MSRYRHELDCSNTYFDRIEFQSSTHAKSQKNAKFIVSITDNSGHSESLSCKMIDELVLRYELPEISSWNGHHKTHLGLVWCKPNAINAPI